MYIYIIYLNHSKEIVTNPHTRLTPARHHPKHTTSISPTTTNTHQIQPVQHRPHPPPHTPDSPLFNTTPKTPHPPPHITPTSPTNRHQPHPPPHTPDPAWSESWARRRCAHPGLSGGCATEMCIKRWVIDVFCVCPTYAPDPIRLSAYSSGPIHTRSTEINLLRTISNTSESLRTRSNTTNNLRHMSNIHQIQYT